MQQDQKPSSGKERNPPANDDAHPQRQPPQNPLAVSVDSPTGRKLIHINTAEYVAHPNDIISEPWIPTRTAQYIFKIITHNNPDDNHFHIHLLPTDHNQWSVVDLNPLVMHLTYKSRPLLIWIIGTLHNYTYTSSIDDPIPRLRVMIDFLRTTDRNAAILLYNASSSGTIRSMDYLTATSPTRDDDGPASHDQIYDATRRLESKGNMRDMSIGRIEGGDIVLLECTLVRTEGIAHIKNVSFALNALYWLAEKPRIPRTKPVVSTRDLPTSFEL